MNVFPAALERLIDKFASLPGVGLKSAQRMAFYVLSLNDERAADFAAAIVDAKRDIRRCADCQNLSDDELCPVCRSDRRDRSIICVVESPKDLLAVERSREYNGLYHVLHGAIAPLRRVGPDDVTIKELIARVERGGVSEVIMATNPGAEGEATAMFITRLLKPFNVRVTRIAYGVPMGGALEFTDEATLFRAMDGRVEIGNE
jgi:recombination protein RecR